jgi:hypothetical protein
VVLAQGNPPPLPYRPLPQADSGWGLPPVLGVLEALNPLRLLDVPAHDNTDVSADAPAPALERLRGASFVRASSAPSASVPMAPDSFSRSGTCYHPGHPLSMSLTSPVFIIR